MCGLHQIIIDYDIRSHFCLPCVFTGIIIHIVGMLGKELLRTGSCPYNPFRTSIMVNTLPRIPAASFRSRYTSASMVPEA